MLKFDFHVSRAAREKYTIEQSLFSTNGKIILADYQQARNLSEKINSKRSEEGIDFQFVTAGQINALGLLHEIFHLLIRKYEEDDNPGVFAKAISHLKNEISENGLHKTLLAFVDEFPPLSVYTNALTKEEYLKGISSGKPNKEIILEELILLQLENSNPAASGFREFFADDNLTIKTNYRQLIEKAEIFFDNEKPASLGGLPLFKLLRKPILSNPYDLEQQLEFIRTEYGDYLGDDIQTRLLRSVDLIREDYKLFVPHGVGEKGTPPVPDYKEDLERLRLVKEKIAAEKKLTEEERKFYLEYEKFTEDIHWMPEVVMLAKNVFVWLHQLSEKYKREIKRLDQIPDEVLDQIARWNFNALWLIGIWERSSASQKIKHLTGNISAVSSAYSLYDYIIAEELGGESAFQNLKDRAWVRGIRMASDMVPNHTGIYSRWVIDEPDYYLQRDEPPFPNYSFTGPNLSEDDRVEIRIEDKYFSMKDAAVVFQRKDRYTGAIRYIYHGNDGTNMPWNDTAQLNLLSSEVRESLIQTIMHVARKTPIIRFDAAMTLAKKHYQRLWFPSPGSGGAIPSRTDYSMTIEQFNKLMPEEFWREVVDRINSTMPNVLLLAEAFWLMESYFVRTLGMHRVYNSAFMHMMMKEENEKYRQLIKNTLEFNPEILKRYVNFMSNPDEETAVNQFSKGDKYFGVAVMMVTMPGLPMFGHGQIEGFSEKYGMEYKRSFYNEKADEYLIHRHQREIFPLMKMRNLFSQVYNFELYNFIADNGKVNNDVYAFSNRSGSEMALVIYNNSYYETRGSIDYPSVRAFAGQEGSVKHQEKISSLFGFKIHPAFFYEYTDHRTQLKYLVSGKEIYENGFQFHLSGYQYRVCINFSEIFDTDGKYSQLHFHLKGRGVYSLEDAIKEMELIPLHSAVENYIADENLEKFRSYLTFSEKVKFKKQVEPEIPGNFKSIFSSIVTEINNANGFSLKESGLWKELEKDFKKTRTFFQLWIRYNQRKSSAKWLKEMDTFLPVKSELKIDENLCILFLTLSLRRIGSATNNHGLVKLFEELLLGIPLNNTFKRNQYSSDSYTLIEVLKFLIQITVEKNDNAVPKKKSKSKKVKNNDKSKNDLEKPELTKQFMGLLTEINVYNFLQVNEFENTIYFNKEKLELAAGWILLLTAIESVKSSSKAQQKKDKDKINKKDSEPDAITRIKSEFEAFVDLKVKSELAGYDLKKLIEVLHSKKKKKLKNSKNKKRKRKE